MFRGRHAMRVPKRRGGPVLEILRTKKGGRYVIPYFGFRVFLQVNQNADDVQHHGTKK